MKLQTPLLGSSGSRSDNTYGVAMVQLGRCRIFISSITCNSPGILEDE